MPESPKPPIPENLPPGEKERRLKVEYKGGQREDEKLELNIKKRKEIVANLKKLCEKNKIHPTKLNRKTLGNWMAENPEQFFNLRTIGGMLNTYFADDMQTLRDMVAGIK
jgi:hypothetical protein